MPLPGMRERSLRTICRHVYARPLAARTGAPLQQKRRVTSDENATARRHTGWSNLPEGSREARIRDGGGEGTYAGTKPPPPPHLLGPNEMIAHHLFEPDRVRSNLTGGGVVAHTSPALEDRIGANDSCTMRCFSWKATESIYMYICMYAAQPVTPPTSAMQARSQHRAPSRAPDAARSGCAQHPSPPPPPHARAEYT